MIPHAGGCFKPDFIMNHFNGRRLAFQWAMVSVLPVSSLFHPALAADGVLRVSAIPDEAPTELQRKFAPLGNYLSAKTGLKVVFTPVTDYAAVVEALAAGKIDLAWLGGFTFFQARIRTNGSAYPSCSAKKTPDSPPNSSPLTRPSKA